MEKLDLLLQDRGIRCSFLKNVIYRQRRDRQFICQCRRRQRVRKWLQVNDDESVALHYRPLSGQHPVLRPKRNYVLRLFQIVAQRCYVCYSLPHPGGVVREICNEYDTILVVHRIVKCVCKTDGYLRSDDFTGRKKARQRNVKVKLQWLSDGSLVERTFQKPDTEVIDCELGNVYLAADWRAANSNLLWTLLISSN